MYHDTDSMGRWDRIGDCFESLCLVAQVRLPLGRRVDVRIHAAAISVFLFPLFSVAKYCSTPAELVAELGFIVLCGFQILVIFAVHELGHFIAAKKMGMRVGSVVLAGLINFVVIEPKDFNAVSKARQLAVIMAGPLVNLVFGGLLYLGYSKLPLFMVFPTMRAMGFLSMIIGAINGLIPIYPLDGGKAMAIVLHMLSLKTHRRIIFVKGASVVAAFGVGFYSFVCGEWIDLVLTVLIATIGFLIVGHSEGAEELDRHDGEMA